MHSCELNQPERQLVDNFQRPAHRLDRLQGMNIGKAGHPRDLFVEARVVLHCATTERKQPQINAVILPAQPRVVAYSFGFGQAGQSHRLCAIQPA